jgi:hypothetical protein
LMLLMLKLAIFIGSATDTRHGFARSAPYVSDRRLRVRQRADWWQSSHI